jgi:hypothetical protein
VSFTLSSPARSDVVRILDSYASLLVLLLANFFLLELVDDPRWAALGSTLLAAAALVVANSESHVGRRSRSPSVSRSRRSCSSSTRPQRSD